MVTYTCTGKERDRNNNIKRYFLKNIDTQEQTNATSDQIKAAISNHQIEVTNLQIDNSGKLIDRSTSKKPLSDMTNSELFNHIMDMKDNDKASREQLFRLIKELCRRYTLIDNKVKQILQQLYTQDTQGQNDLSIENQIDDIMSYLLANQNDLQQINNNISTLTSQLNNIGNPSSNPANESNNTLLTEDGHFDMPSDPYSNYFYKKYFVPTVDDSTVALDTDILNLLKTEIEKAYKAYGDTREFYIAQLSDYTKNMQTGLFTDIVNVASETVMSTIGAPVEITKKALSQFGYFLAGQVPCIDNQVKARKARKIFGEKQDISKEQANTIMKSIGGIWNNAISFVENNEEWEIMLYVIQTLNHTNLKTYKISANSIYNTVESNKGQMEKGVDVSLTDKRANSLTEKSLKVIYEYISKCSNGIKDKIYECEEQVYDRFIICYFASKKVLYHYQLYPFNKTTQQIKEINGVLIKLLETGLKLCCVQDGIINMYIETFCNYNNNKKEYEHHINMNVDINNFIHTA